MPAEDSLDPSTGPGDAAVLHLSCFYTALILRICQFRSALSAHCALSTVYCGAVHTAPVNAFLAQASADRENGPTSECAARTARVKLFVPWRSIGENEQTLNQYRDGVDAINKELDATWQALGEQAINIQRGKAAGAVDGLVKDGVKAGLESKTGRTCSTRPASRTPSGPARPKPTSRPTTTARRAREAGQSQRGVAGSAGSSQSSEERGASAGQRGADERGAGLQAGRGSSEEGGYSPVGRLSDAKKPIDPARRRSCRPSTRRGIPTSRRDR